MKPLIIDVETTTHEKGDPFSTKNKLCLVGLQGCYQPQRIFSIEYDDDPYGHKLKEIQEIVDGHDLLVGVNLKFDLHWLRRYGINFDGKRVFDCQLAEFLYSHQTVPYPSLDSMASRRGLGNKLVGVAEKYWDNGIDTTEIPLDELTEYLAQDLNLTEQLYNIQVKELEEHSKLQRLFSLQCQDLLVLEEMEYNGLLLDVTKAEELSQKCQKQLDNIDEEFRKLVGSDTINFNSNEHMSAVLYGGVAKVKGKENYLFQYKDGRVAPKVRSVVFEYKFEQLVKPLRGTALAKEGYFSTAEDVLRQLHPSNKKSRRVIELILERSKLEKLNGTYYQGLQKKVLTKAWPNNYIHGNLNQCVVITGRLSSSDPNLQNVAKEVHECIISRYAD